MMQDAGPSLSAYIDGELPLPDRRALEARLAADPALRAELAALTAADAAARADLAAMLDLPVPAALVGAVRRGAAPAPLSRALPPWLAVAAGLALAAFGALGGYLARGTEEPADWATEIAEYHAVYAAQPHHLVEVPAEQSAEIVRWLTGAVGTPVTIPDLAANGLVFQGARLLVVTDRPVGQLMYRDDQGRVVALCVIAGGSPGTGPVTPHPLDGFDALVWAHHGARYILIGPKGYPGLADIAATARAA